jgi:hypothetical protein
VDPDESVPRASVARTGLVGTLVGLWWALDTLVQLTVILLAVWLNALVVFVAALIVLTVINNACCTWIEGRWDGWISSRFGTRLEQRLEKMRAGRVMRHPAAWITRGSDAWFGLAAALTNAITTVTIAHMVSGQPVGKRRVLIASVSFAALVAGLGSLLGLLLRDAIRAL